MKCPKCGYTSFDHNANCPRCLKNIAAERHQLNLPAFTPNPPYLLGPLSGELGVKKIGLETEQMASPPLLEQVPLPGPEDSQAIQALEMAFEADQDTDIPFDIPRASAEPDPGLDKEPEGTDLLDLSFDDLETVPTPTAYEATPKEDEVEFDLSPDALTLAQDDLLDLEDDLFFDVDDASLDEALHQISDQTANAVFMDDEATLEDGLEGPMDLDKLASMVESINEDETPALEGQKRSFDPSLGIEHMMEDEILEPDVTLGKRSERAQPGQKDPPAPLPADTPP